MTNKRKRTDNTQINTIALHPRTNTLSYTHTRRKTHSHNIGTLSNPRSHKFVVGGDDNITDLRRRISTVAVPQCYTPTMFVGSSEIVADTTSILPFSPGRFKTRLSEA